MPRRFYAKRRRGRGKRSFAARKRRGKRSFKNRPTSAVVNRPGKEFLPDRLFTKLQYAQTVTLTGTTGAVAAHIFRLNDVYDPDYTGAGTQPLAFDQFMALYNRFMVHGSTCRIALVASDTPTISTYISLAAMPQSTTVSVMETQMERADSVVKTWMANSDRPAFIKMYRSLRSVQGLTKSLTNADALWSGTSSSSPSRQAFWHINARSVNASSTVTVHVKVVITYFVELFERLRQDAS